ncbi:MAG: hypothetical protein IT515_11605 [Burkholderiales bacterium]|nr:hypothetical protein [Burkholderiales bacterium]
MEGTVAAVRDMLEEGRLPPPVNDSRCKECSLREICQPEIVSAGDRLTALAHTLFDPDVEAWPALHADPAPRSRS